MTFPLFLGVLFGILSTAATLAWLFARGEGSGHH
jgi:hypothetical protein